MPEEESNKLREKVKYKTFMKSRLFEFGDIISNGKKNFRSTVGLKF